MELKFNEATLIMEGDQPSMIHEEFNNVWFFNVEDGTLRNARAWGESGDVDWDNLEGHGFRQSTRDKEVDFSRLKSIGRVGIYGVWKDQKDGFERFRLAVWRKRSDISRFISDVVIESKSSTIVSTLDMKLINKKDELLTERGGSIQPGTMIELFFQAGDLNPYLMGTFYIDRIRKETGEGEIAIEGRSISGKIFRDQTLDENNRLERKPYPLNVVEFFENANVPNFKVQPVPDVPDPWEYGVEYPREMPYIEALENLIAASRNWKVVETPDGEIIAGSVVTFPDIQINSKYNFSRNEDLFSRMIINDDDDVYARVAVFWLKSEIIDGEEVMNPVYYYKAIENEANWDTPPHKTLYIQIEDNYNESDALEILQDIAEQMAKAGKVEMFQGPIRPQLLIGDEAEIESGGTVDFLGVVTNIKHRMGMLGFHTEFAVDSGEQRGRPTLSEYISKISRFGNRPKGKTI